MKKFLSVMVFVIIVTAQAAAGFAKPAPGNPVVKPALPLDRGVVTKKEVFKPAAKMITIQKNQIQLLTDAHFSKHSEDYSVRKLSDQFVFYGTLAPCLSWEDLTPRSVTLKHWEDEHWIDKEIPNARVLVAAQLTCNPPLDGQGEKLYDCGPVGSVKRYVISSSCQAIDGPYSEPTGKFQCVMSLADLYNQHIPYAAYTEKTDQEMMARLLSDEFRLKSFFVRAQALPLVPQPELGSTLISPALDVNAALSSVADADGDSIPDAFDACPMLPQDFQVSEQNCIRLSVAQAEYLPTAVKQGVFNADPYQYTIVWSEMDSDLIFKKATITGQFSSQVQFIDFPKGFRLWYLPPLSPSQAKEIPITCISSQNGAGFECAFRTEELAEALMLKPVGLTVEMLTKLYYRFLEGDAALRFIFTAGSLDCALCRSPELSAQTFKGQSVVGETVINPPEENLIVGNPNLQGLKEDSDQQVVISDAAIQGLTKESDTGITVDASADVSDEVASRIGVDGSGQQISGEFETQMDNAQTFEPQTDMVIKQKFAEDLSAYGAKILAEQLVLTGRLAPEWSFQDLEGISVWQAGVGCEHPLGGCVALGESSAKGGRFQCQFALASLSDLLQSSFLERSDAVQILFGEGSGPACPIFMSPRLTPRQLLPADKGVSPVFPGR